MKLYQLKTPMTITAARITDIEHLDDGGIVFHLEDGETVSFGKHNLLHLRRKPIRVGDWIKEFGPGGYGFEAKEDFEKMYKEVSE
jgi:hypothetical protein